MAKAYQELERLKIIETIRGKGAYISAEIDIKKVDKDKLESIEKELSIHLLDMIYMGMDKEEILKLVESLYDKVKH